MSLEQIIQQAQEEIDADFNWENTVELEPRDELDFDT